MRDRPILFTVDVESDWGSGETRGIEEALPRMLEGLDRHEAKATFFVVGELVSPFQRFLSPSSPHEVASHGMTHGILTRMTAEETAFEIKESKGALEAKGYKISGFRAPFLKRPKGLNDYLQQSGYRYDSSAGSVCVSPANLIRHIGPPENGSAIYRLGTSALRDGMTPFSMTYLRLFHPFGLHMVPARTAVFYCHLHEFLSPPGGWHSMPRLLQKVHARNTGEKAWQILEALLGSRRRFISCRDYLEEAR